VFHIDPFALVWRTGLRGIDRPAVLGQFEDFRVQLLSILQSMPDYASFVLQDIAPCDARRNAGTKEFSWGTGLALPPKACELSTPRQLYLDAVSKWHAPHTAGARPRKVVAVAFECGRSVPVSGCNVGLPPR
jgi:hypothetical protein